MKKTGSIFVALVLLAGILIVPASARCGMGGGYRRSAQRTTLTETQYAVCPVEDCTVRGIHEHDGVSYLCTYHDTATCGTDCYGEGYGAGGHCARWLTQ